MGEYDRLKSDLQKERNSTLADEARKDEAFWSSKLGEAVQYVGRRDKEISRLRRNATRNATKTRKCVNAFHKQTALGHQINKIRCKTIHHYSKFTDNQKDEIKRKDEKIKKKDEEIRKLRKKGKETRSQM